MPSFTIYDIEVDVDVDVDVNEFLWDCSEEEIEDVIEWLKDNDYLEDNTLVVGETTDNMLDKIYKEALNKLSDKRINLSLEEEQFLINLANKY